MAEIGTFEVPYDPAVGTHVPEFRCAPAGRLTGCIVTGDTDFLELYEMLGLEPGCDLATLQLAYRRRISALHPDRHADADPSSAPMELHRLTTSYRAAILFYRTHGRLPGNVASSGHLKSTHTMRRGSAIPNQPASTKPSRKRSRIWVLFILSSVIIAILYKRPGDVTPQQTQTVSSSAGWHEAAAPDDRELKLGMQKEQVRHLLGEPDMVEGNRWDYGPSWILFGNGHVVDWYGSPLRPIKTSSSTPDSSERP